MDIYAIDDYKLALRLRTKELAKTKKGLTLQKIAAQIPIQNTYLSKALRDEKTHLNEDHLFKACKILQFFPQEIDYLFLLRGRVIATNEDRKSYLDTKINRLRQANRRSAEFQELDSRLLNQEMAYLFEPLCILVHVALFIKEYKENVRRISPMLGISLSQLRNILSILQSLNFIELDTDGLTVLAVKTNQIHYGTDHPLMRTHQSLLRTKSLSFLNQVPEDGKNIFMGTFSADQEAFLEIKNRFQTFLKDIEPIVNRAPSKNVFQINFDLFRWF